VWRCVAGCAVHPVGDAGAGEGKRSVGARSVPVGQRESERLVMGACREPKTRSAAEESSPQARAERTIAIWCEGVFRRYRGVLRLEVNVGWQAGPRNVWIRSVRPCVPSPKRRVDVSVGDPAGRPLRVRTSEAVGVHALGCASAAFHLTPGPHWHRGRSHTWGAEATDGTIKRGAWPEKTVDHRASAPCL
jgi:hypothetical protein